MLLYGFGRQRSEVKKSVLKVCKHFVKLVKGKRELLPSAAASGGDTWTPGSINNRRKPPQAAAVVVAKKPSGGGGRSSKTSLAQSTIAELIARFCSLSYFDRHVVVSHGMRALLATLNAYISER